MSLLTDQQNPAAHRVLALCFIERIDKVFAIDRLHMSIMVASCICKELMEYITAEVFITIMAVLHPILE